MKDTVIAVPIGTVTRDDMIALVNGETRLDDLPVSVEYKNLQFEVALYETAKQVLKPSIEPEGYCEEVLNNLWCADLNTYADSNGDERYHEIGSKYTKDGNPVVISYQ